MDLIHHLHDIHAFWQRQPPGTFPYLSPTLLTDALLRSHEAPPQSIWCITFAPNFHHGQRSVPDEGILTYSSIEDELKRIFR